MSGGKQEKTRRVALVTGAASGIGAATAKRFDEDDSYDTVACLDIDESVHDFVDSLENGLPFKVDVADHDAILGVVNEIEENGSRIDAAVANAAVSTYYWIGDLEPEEWDRVLDINLKGQYNVARAVGPRMYERGHGYIVTVSSGAGQKGSASGGVHYSASKSGIFGLTKGLAKQLGPDVRVNCVVPGLIETPLTTDSSLWTPEGIKEFVEDIPLERLGQPDEVARVIQFLCGEGASYVTGSVINADGGAVLR